MTAGSRSDAAGHSAIAAELLRLGTATLYEASGLDCVLPIRLRPAWRGAAVAGPAFPVRAAAGDNLPMHAALELILAGEVLVIDTGAADFGYWGEVLTVAAQARGVVGLVIDGGVRDVDRLEQLGFPVFCSAIALRGTAKRWPGSLGVPIRLGDVPVARGDMVVADTDGVVALPAAEVDRILEAGRARAADETGYLARLREGALTLDIYPFRQLLDSDADRAEPGPHRRGG